MARTLLILLLFLPLAKAQAGKYDDRRGLYIEGGGGMGNFNRTKFSLNYLNKTSSFSLFFYDTWRNDSSEIYKVIPDVLNEKFDRPLRNDQHILAVYGLTYGKVLTIDENVRFNIKGGMLLGRYKEPYNFRQISVPNTNGELLYLFDQKKSFTYGAILAPTAELTFTTFVGASLSASFIITPKQTLYGGEVSFLLGILRQLSQRELNKRGR